MNPSVKPTFLVDTQPENRSAQAVSPVPPVNSDAEMDPYDKGWEAGYSCGYDDGREAGWAAGRRDEQGVG